MRAVVELGDQILLEHERFSTLHVMEEGVGLPTSDGRDAFVEAGRRGKEHLACVGILLPTSNIIATTMRAFARLTGTVLRTGVRLIVEQNAQDLARVFSEVHAARTGVTVSPAEILEGIASTRRLGL